MPQINEFSWIGSSLFFLFVVALTLLKCSFSSNKTCINHLQSFLYSFSFLI